jgi:hypothetical protein
MGSWDHPHVQDTKPCFGNISDIYYNLQSHKYASVVEFLHMFLSKWNPQDSWGPNIGKWSSDYLFQYYQSIDGLESLDWNQWNELYREYSGGYNLDGTESYREDDDEEPLEEEEY